MNEIERQAMREQFRKTLKSVGAVEDPAVLRAQKRKGGFLPPRESPSFHMFECDGALIVDLQPPATRIAAGQRRARFRSASISSIPAGAKWVDSWTPPPLEPNQVSAKLAEWDRGWNPDPKLKMWRDGELVAVPAGEIAKAKKIFLIVHGTFSNAAAIVSPLQQQGFLDRCMQNGRYDLVLAFDHPSISVSPVMNAVELFRALDGTTAEIDTIAHSRGGLVTRWWLEALDRGPGRRRAVFFGSPLAGTSLATAGCLKGWMSWFASLNHAIHGVSEAISPILPLMTIVSVLSQLGSIVGDLGSKTPAIDIGAALAPGLLAMSRENAEIVRLNQPRSKWPEYFAVSSDFVPPGVGWEFWKILKDPKLRLWDAATARVFSGPNDLVVDCASMQVLAETSRIEAIHDFGKNGTVYHLNYFEQKLAVEFLASKFQIP
jgi:hypothetical protein